MVTATKGGGGGLTDIYTQFPTYYVYCYLLLIQSEIDELKKTHIPIQTNLAYQYRKYIILTILETLWYTFNKNTKIFKTNT
jgi:hypothetical protein